MRIVPGGWVILSAAKAGNILQSVAALAVRAALTCVLMMPL
jgi:hypothetical protein